MTDSSEPLDHFETLPTSYEALRDVHTTVWLPTHDKVFVEDTIREYQLMRTRGLSDSEFVTYALQNLLRRDPRHPTYEATGRWRIDRALRLAVQISSQWRLPPAPTTSSRVVPLRHHDFKFDVPPVVQYWLTIESFAPEYGRLFGRHIHVLHHGGGLTLPYFAVEWRRDQKPIESAQNQIYTSGAIALYNRCLLKVERLKLTGKKWTEKHWYRLRYYGLVFNGTSYAFWCVRLRRQRLPLSPFAWTWPGCELVELTAGNMLSGPNVEHCIYWINEIHRWGVDAYGRGARQDVEFCIKGKEQVPASVELGPEDTDSELDD